MLFSSSDASQCQTAADKTLETFGRVDILVNVGGTFGVCGKAGLLAYSASKWRLRGITKSSALEAGERNINVNSTSRSAKVRRS
ncbi:SDR family NAD(P)-dependent oxidoreductase [uncultured Martelella sp.]|uniref:SDR family NAD(P)-dependent oxidoreductase n=1 Tax=uncultured Martelella sp. TaxID=392331 RepID=UPI0029C98D1A|nr:SDR family NAD(P)-dependent oxidoreductase [uncultured Martelella sp.]